MTQDRDATRWRLKFGESAGYHKSADAPPGRPPAHCRAHPANLPEKPGHDTRETATPRELRVTRYAPPDSRGSQHGDAVAKRTVPLAHLQLDLDVASSGVAVRAHVVGRRYDLLGLVTVDAGYFHFELHS